MYTLASENPVLYPSFDGQPMADSTLQYDWIVLIKENLERLFADQPLVFVAGDLLWYPIAVANPPAPCQAPDVMVVFGRPKGARKSYMQFHEANIPPQVVFEILSDSNRTAKGKLEMQAKFQFYQEYGVEEYYVYDPERLSLQGWLRNGTLLPIADWTNYISPRLGVRLRWTEGEELQLFFPNGERFSNVVSLAQERDQIRQELAVEREQRLQAERRAAQLAELLERMGVNPDSHD